LSGVTDADITDALRELSLLLARCPSLFSFGYDAIGLYGRDGTIVSGNDALRALTGVEASGYRFGQHVDPSERERARAQFKIALSGEPVEYESLLKHRGGQAINV
jgi:PAS domain-containing protein